MPVNTPSRSLLLSVLRRGPFTVVKDPAERLRRRALSARFRSTVAGDADLGIVYAYERVWLARRAPGITQHDARRRNFANTVALLREHDVPFFAVPNATRTDATIAVEQEHWQRFADAVGTEASGDDGTLHLGIETVNPSGKKRRSVVRADSPAARRALQEQSTIELFEFFIDPDHVRRMGRAEATVVERWGRAQDGSLETAAKNTRTASIDPSAMTPATTELHGVKVPTFAPLDRPTVFETREPVDVVFLWVDGADAEWSARRDRVIEELTGVAPADSIDPSRFRDNGELKYSMRSVFQHCDWVRNIILVTDGQTPSWLDTSHPRIRMVDHRELFGDAGALPTYNSHAIAGRLHHIDGLSDRYLIFNDDVFIGHDIPANQFFEPNGVARFFLSKSTLPVASEFDLTHESARRNAVDLLEREYGVTATRIFYHTPIPQLRHLLLELENEFPEVFTSTWSHQLRSPDDTEINGWLHHYFGYVRKQTMPGDILYNYFDLSDPEFMPRLAAQLKSRKAATFCINDNPDATAENIAYLRDWLETYFPTPAPWELASRP